jgi:high-affinity nickel permease
MTESFDGDWVVTALLLAGALGLRHSADPDHLVAVSTLIAGRRGGHGVRAAARLGAAWGAGHALTLVLFGLPVVLVQAWLPEPAQRLAEAAIGVLIVGLAVRLLARYRRGAFHVHAHEHEGVAHTHLHSHASGAVHRHAHPTPRSPLAAFLIGCLHGTGGSAAVGVLLVASVPDRSTAVAALLVFAAGTAVSMAALSAAFGRILTAAPVRTRLRAAIPALGTFGLLFGAWYALSAWGLAPIG